MWVYRVLLQYFSYFLHGLCAFCYVFVIFLGCVVLTSIIFTYFSYSFFSIGPIIAIAMLVNYLWRLWVKWPPSNHNKTQELHNVCTIVGSTVESYDAGDEIFRLWESIPCLLMFWLLTSAEHQQAWRWLCRTNNLYFGSRVNLIYLCSDKTTIQLKMSIYLS